MLKLLKAWVAWKPWHAMVGEPQVLQTPRSQRAEHFTQSHRGGMLGGVSGARIVEGLPSAGAFAWRHRCATTKVRQFSRRRSKIASSDTVTNDNG